MTPNETPSPQELHAIKDALLQRWHQLPHEHQASMVLVLLRDLLQTEQRQWLMDVLPLITSDHDDR